EDLSLVTGGPETGKTCLALGVAAAALARGDSTCWVTEASAREVVEAAAWLVGLDLSVYVRCQRLTVLRFGTGFERAVRIDGREPFRILARHFGERQVRTVIFDTLRPLFAGTELGQAWEFAHGLITHLRGLGVMCVCTAAPSNDAERPLVEQMALEAGAPIALRRGGGRRTLPAYGWAGEGRAGEEIPFAIAPGRGLVPEEEATQGAKPAGSPRPPPRPPPR